MRRCLSQCANPPLATREGRRMDFELLRRGDERRRCLKAGDVRPMTELGLQVTPKDCACRDEVPIFF